MNLNQFLRHPAIATVRYGQLVLSIVIYCYFALSGLRNITVTLDDSVLHFAGNVLLFGSIWLATYFVLRLRWQLCIAIPFAFLIELAQGFSSTRHVDVTDMLFNLMGIFLGASICFCVHYTFLRTPNI